MEANFAVEHMHASLDAQTDGQICLKHRLQSKGCLCFDCSLGIAGTPCKPYSLQRPKRFADGSVKGHRDHKLTESELVSWLAQTCPEAGFFENVPGWDMPEHVDEAETPMARLCGGK